MTESLSECHHSPIPFTGTIHWYHPLTTTIHWPTLHSAFVGIGGLAESQTIPDLVGLQAGSDQAG